MIPPIVFGQTNDEVRALVAETLYVIRNVLVSWLPHCSGDASEPGLTALPREDSRLWAQVAAWRA
jgi:hypothetical protein